MAKIVVTTPLIGEEGKVIEEGSFRTLRSTCCAVLYATLRGDDGLAPEKKSRLGYLALLFEHQDEVDLKAEDIATIKDRVAKGCPNLIVVRVHRLLEGKEQQPSIEELQAMLEKGA